MSHTLHPTKVILFLFCLLTISCSKDTDLLTDYIALEDGTYVVKGKSKTDSAENAEEATTEESVETTDSSSDDFPDDKAIDGAFFVTTTGNSSNDGLTEATSWSIEHAFKTAQPGDIVYVKAGNYGDYKLSTVRSGTLQNPISFIGYQYEPGDIVASNGSTYSKQLWENNGNTLPESLMPLLDNFAYNNNPPKEHKAIEIKHSNIIIENFMLQDYYDGVFVYGAQNVQIRNVIAARLGNWNPQSNCWGKPDSYECDNRTGYGLHIVASDQYIIENCLVIDAGHAGIDIISSDNGIMNDSEVWSATTGNATDYNIILWNSDYNVFNNIRSYRNKGLYNTSHQGRALAVKCGSDFNQVNGLDAENLRLQVYYGSSDNEFTDIHLEGNGSSNDSGIQIYGNANRNIFTNATITNGSGISFLGDSASECTEKGHSGTDISGNDNYFFNLNISNVVGGSGQAAISFHRLGSKGTGAGTNYIIGGSIDNVPHLLNTNRPGTINFKDCIIKNIYEGYKTFYSSTSNGWINYEIVVNFDNVTFSNNNFEDPTG